MHIIFYSLPEHPHFYPELVNMLTEASVKGMAEDIDAVVLFSKYEKMALERIVGKERCNHMINSNKTTFVFK
jgi:U3 small nucleolar RNA-associated protein 25